LPLQIKPYLDAQTRAFFSGFLPDSLARYRLAKYLGVSEKNAFALLEIVGGECAGAVSLYPEGIIPLSVDKASREVLDDQRLAEILHLLKSRPLLAGDQGLRLSLAGAQDKLAVCVEKNQVVLVKDAPTTHILKPLIQDIEESVLNELFCMQLAAKVGINTAKTCLGFLNETPYLLVTRYDRLVSKTGVLRLHQEDFCQALGILPDIKYEREGGPSIVQCQNIITTACLKPAVDQIQFLKCLLFNYLIANADAHGKNFSLLYQSQKPSLSPAYDLLCTAVYTDMATKMAMKIGSKYQPEAVFNRHWYQLVVNTAGARKNLRQQMRIMVDACRIEAVTLEKSFKKLDIQSPIFAKIIKIINTRADLIIKRLLL